MAPAGEAAVRDAAVRDADVREADVGEADVGEADVGEAAVRDAYARPASVKTVAVRAEFIEIQRSQMVKIRRFFGGLKLSRYCHHHSHQLRRKTSNMSRGPCDD